MTRWHLTSPPPLPSRTKRSRGSIYDKDRDDKLSTITANDHDHQVENLESDNEPLWRPSGNAIGKWPSTDSFTSICGKLVMATQFTPVLAQPLHCQHQKVYIIPEKEVDPCQPAPLASKTLSH
jgi:hypothetical protein